MESEKYPVRERFFKLPSLMEYRRFFLCIASDYRLRLQAITIASGFMCLHSQKDERNRRAWILKFKKRRRDAHNFTMPLRSSKQILRLLLYRRNSRYILENDENSTGFNLNSVFVFSFGLPL